MRFKQSWRAIVSGAIVVLGGLMILGVSLWQIFLVLLALACPLLHFLGLHGGHGGHGHEGTEAEKPLSTRGGEEADVDRQAG